MTRWLLWLLLFAPATVPEIELRPLHGLKADVAALILAGRESGALRAAVLAVPGARPAAGVAERVAVWVEVDGPGLVAGSSTDALPESLPAELHVYAMTASGELAASLGRRLRLPVAELLRSRVKLATYLDLPPGEYRLHVLVRELYSQRFALRLVPLTVEPGTGTPGAGAPAAGAPAVEGAWIVNRETDGEVGGGSSAEAGLLAWNGLRIPSEEAQQPAIELSGRRRTSKQIQAVAGAYRGVLDRLASGLLDDAVDGLRELETEIEAHEDPKLAWGWLVVAQDRIIQELAENDPESLLPLLALHMKRHDRIFKERKLYSLHSTSTRRRIVELARTYGEKSHTDLAPDLAAAALTDLGGAYVQDRRYEVGRPILESALALDDDHVVALFYLAFVDESHGRYQDSASALRRALAVVPRSEEGRLRLALSLRRLGRSDEAVGLLLRLIDELSEAWLLTIAYEELGRLMLAGEGPEDAVRLLEQGLSRLPEQQRLYTQLSYFLDRSGQRRRGREVLATMPADTGRPSPRKLYSEPPRDDDGSREELLRHSTARFPVLAQALARLRAEEDR